MKHCEIDIAQGRRSRCVTWTGSSVGRELRLSCAAACRGFESRSVHRSFIGRDAGVARDNIIIIHLTKAAAKGQRRVRAPRFLFVALAEMQ